MGFKIRLIEDISEICIKIVYHISFKTHCRYQCMLRFIINAAELNYMGRFYKRILWVYNHTINVDAHIIFYLFHSVVPKE